MGVKTKAPAPIAVGTGAEKPVALYT